MSLRNIAIIAHVDHGKTTLVDSLLKQSGEIRDNQRVAERALDSSDLEKERGITILAKCTSVMWKDTRINIVDTPGHADFGGEVERILSMVDGVLILVDAAEGVLPQTKFVCGKALVLGLCPLVIINKVDRSDARPNEVLEEIFDLFVALGANDKQLDFPLLYASGRDGWASDVLDGEKNSLSELFNLILKHVPKPTIYDGPLRMLVTALESDPFVGRVLTGRINSGKVYSGQTLKALSHTGEVIEQTRINKLLAFRGLERIAVSEASAGDIVAVAGFKKATVADTLGDESIVSPIIAQPIDPPTLAMTFQVNDSPLSGTEGNKISSRVLRERLFREAEGNVSIVVESTEASDAFEVSGRGELQLGVLIETMRREGFELAISRPRVLYKYDLETNIRLEPIEEAIIDVDEPYMGIVVEKLAHRKGELYDSRPSGAGKLRLVFNVPSRGLIGYHDEFLTDTRGTGVINRSFLEYRKFRGNIQGRRNGVIISNSGGVSVAYALWQLEDRGSFFIIPGEKVYHGMIIGEHTRDSDLEVNPLKSKQLTNIRASGRDEAIRLIPPRKITLEYAMTYINEDELVEVTPKSIRLRKKILVSHERKRALRDSVQ